MKKPAAFLDRDGTIIVDKHYLKDPSQIEFLPRAIKALEILKKADYEIIVITNQSGVNRGLLEMADVYKVNEKLSLLLEENNLNIKDYGICPHTPDENCECRKPSPKLIYDMATKHNIDLSKSFMAGDKDSDVQAGLNAKIKSYLIKSDDLLDIVNKHLS